MPRTQRRREQPAQAHPANSVDPAEVEKFSILGEEWWDPDGRMGQLHKLNPVRLAFIRQHAVSHFGRAEADLRPFEGLSLLDVGCGAGLLSEPLARLGFRVTGVDASERNLEIARQHARSAGLRIDYSAMTAESLAHTGQHFDVVVAMEVVEHVADLNTFLDACAGLVVPGGLLFLATINKTLKSLALAKIGAEFVLRWAPVGAHDWNKFVTPTRLKSALARSGCVIKSIRGVTFDPLLWNWRSSPDTDVNYMLVASQPNSPR